MLLLKFQSLVSATVRPDNMGPGCGKGSCAAGDSGRRGRQSLSPFQVFWRVDELKGRFADFYSLKSVRCQGFYSSYNLLFPGYFRLLGLFFQRKTRILALFCPHLSSFGPLLLF